MRLRVHAPSAKIGLVMIASIALGLFFFAYYGTDQLVAKPKSDDPSTDDFGIRRRRLEWICKIYKVSGAKIWWWSG